MFYTYLYLREDGTPYYVGKGSGDRAHKWHRVGCPPVERILSQEFPSESDAFEAEKFLIGFYGREDLRMGRLLNLTDGGENPPDATGNKHNCGRVRSVEARKKCSESLKRAWAEGRHTGTTGRKVSEIQKERQRLAMKAHAQEVGNRFGGKPWSAARRQAYEARYV